MLRAMKTDHLTKDSRTADRLTASGSLGGPSSESLSGPLSGPLSGLKVIELGQLIAGPFAAKTLADFGADVIKIEPPASGDPLRKWRLLKDGTSVVSRIIPES